MKITPQDVFNFNDFLWKWRNSKNQSIVELFGIDK